MRDPLELYEYPEEWVSERCIAEGRSSVKRKIESGLFILTAEGWLRRGITTGTTATAAILGAVLWKERVEVQTPAGIPVFVNVRLKRASAEALKFAGDHAFDATDRLKIIAKIERGKRRGHRGHDIVFGEGIGTFKNGRKAVSEAVLRQISENLRRIEAELSENTILVEVPSGREVAKRTGNEQKGIFGGVSLLGTTGFVEPWCEKLLRTKIEIARRYDKIALTTGRSGWRFCMQNLRGFQPFVFGVHIEEALSALQDCEEIVIVGAPSLLLKWAMPEKWRKMQTLKGRKREVAIENISKAVLKKARSINENVSEAIILSFFA